MALEGQGGPRKEPTQEGEWSAMVDPSFEVCGDTLAQPGSTGSTGLARWAGQSTSMLEQCSLKRPTVAYLPAAHPDIPPMPQKQGEHRHMWQVSTGLRDKPAAELCLRGGGGGWPMFTLTARTDTPEAHARRGGCTRDDMDTLVTLPLELAARRSTTSAEKGGGWRMYHNVSTLSFCFLSSFDDMAGRGTRRPAHRGPGKGALLKRV